MQISVPQASRNEVPNPKNPILKNDWKICPKKEGQGFLEQVEVRHATLKGGTASENPPLPFKCGMGDFQGKVKTSLKGVKNKTRVARDKCKA